MNIVQAFILGIVQGLTEFLPVSSSGHLVIFEHILKTNLQDISFDVFAHTGTLIAVIAFYRRDLINIARQLSGRILQSRPNREESDEIHSSWLWYIIIGSIPAAIIGLSFEASISAAFKNVKLVGMILIFCGLMLISTIWARRGKKAIDAPKALFIGIAQALAILPGLSRSGTTITTGLFLGINPIRAADFSFLLSIPAVAGATILKLREALSSAPFRGQIAAYVMGALASLIVGYLSIAWMLAFIRKGKFFYFGVYCCLVGAGVLFFLS